VAVLFRLGLFLLPLSGSEGFLSCQAMREPVAATYLRESVNGSDLVLKDTVDWKVSQVQLFGAAAERESDRLR
jgi:hypothetical protein